MELKVHNSIFARAFCTSSLNFLLLLLLVIFSSVGLSSSQLETPTAESNTDHLALLSFKSLISDDPFGALASWSNASLHFCQWRGVTCSTYDHQLRATALELESLGLVGKISPSISNLSFLQRLHLPENQLQGPIPEELGLLSHLQHLNLSFNPLGGVIPVSLFQNCSQLQNFSMNQNDLHGTIPRSLSRCSQLQLIGSANNRLEGEIPRELGFLSKLKVLTLKNNSLTGLPSEIGNLTSLTQLNLIDNQLTGTIPASIQNLTSLIVLDLSNNQLTGGIPRNLGRCSELQYLDLANNTLEGEIPSDLGSLSELRMLSLWGNHLTGTIPPEIGKLANLRDLALFENNLEGSIPAEIGNLISLRGIYLHENQLAGSIPSQIGNLANLTTLSVSINNLSGSIPPEVGNLANLVELYLDQNQLTGPIPPELGNLVNLTLLGLIINSLTGTIPATIGNLTSLYYLGVALNNLGGVIPPSIWNLSSLTTLEIQSNHFYGSIPPDIGITLPLIEELHVNNNQFNGPLPISLSNATNIKNIQLYENNFTGTIPRGLGSLQSLFHFDLSYNQLEARNDLEWGFLYDLTNCSSLKYLQITGNKLSGFLPSIANFSTTLEWFEINNNYIRGSIPAEFGNLASLSSIRFNSNLFTGNIPATLGNLQNLQVLDLSRNFFTGKIPATLGNLTRLLELHLYSNQFRGNIPATLGNCPLELLDLAFNKLNGTVPKEILSIPTLSKYINISYNALVGALPSEVGNMKNLGILNISGNSLSGKIPSTLGQCEQLEYLDMAGNYFEGPIPSSFSKLKALQSLDLSRNNLSGSIPEFFGNFPFLSYMNLSFNNFDGEVPKDGIFRNLKAFSVLGNDKLCGGEQNLHLPPCPIQSSKKNHLSRKLLVSISVAGGIICLIFVLLVGILHWKCKSKKDPHATDSTKYPHVKVSYAELLKATNGFSITNLIGVGSFGSVYKGFLNDNKYEILAVKVLNLQQRGASRSFIAECEALRSIRHRNLVKILTVCTSTDFRGNDFKALVYEFMPNGSLEKWLHPEANDQGHTQRLSFIQRLNILIDVASALDYLHHHHGGAEPIVHCDIKPSNVLLDNDMVAHVSDFGLARFLNRIPIEAALQRSTSSMILKGSIGYVAPEYGVANKVSAEGDVYSYGILVLEMLTGKRPTSETFKDGLNLPRYVEMALSDRAADVMDPNMHLEEEGIQDIRQRAMECVTLSLWVGIKCAKHSPLERMQIGDVVIELAAIRNAYLNTVKVARLDNKQQQMQRRGTSGRHQ